MRIVKSFCAVGSSTHLRRGVCSTLLSVSTTAGGYDAISETGGDKRVVLETVIVDPAGLVIPPGLP